MSHDKDGGPAFPLPITATPSGNIFDSEEIGVHGGMSLRDWFAGMAMSGIFASSDFFNTDHTFAASDAYAIADAMLYAREQEDVHRMLTDDA